MGYANEGGDLMDHSFDLSQIVSLIAEGKMTELEAERLLNAAARYESGVPTSAGAVDSEHRNK